MNAATVFGLAVRLIGVVLWPIAGWQIYDGLYVLAGRSSWVNTLSHAAYWSDEHSNG